MNLLSTADDIMSRVERLAPAYAAHGYDLSATLDFPRPRVEIRMRRTVGPSWNRLTRFAAETIDLYVWDRSVRPPDSLRRIVRRLARMIDAGVLESIDKDIDKDKAFPPDASRHQPT